MWQRNRHRWVPVAMTLVLVLGWAYSQAETTTVNGEVEATQYDDEGNVIEVAILDPTWGSILVLEGDKGDDLLNLVGAVVTATGDLREGDDDPYPYTIRVTDYTVDVPAEPDGRHG